ncbi:MAG: hypothetical protein ISS48_04030 [Candidatus Aenigmarchaeota archaeon]|nr:hypothetical protein [Candidatus Aenigmarchaeota archaeon]
MNMKLVLDTKKLMKKETLFFFDKICRIPKTSIKFDPIGKVSDDFYKRLISKVNMVLGNNYQL